MENNQTKKAVSPRVNKAADLIYEVGFKNGGIEMKNKILKGLNRDWSLFNTMSEMKLLVKVLKKIQKIK